MDASVRAMGTWFVSFVSPQLAGCRLGRSVSEAREISVVPASPDEAALLERLLELYLHDLSETFPIDVDLTGRFGYEALPLYWEEPDRRFPFLIRRDGRAVGFALVTRGSPATDDPSDLDVAEFFVLRRHRYQGTGRAAAIQLWDRMPGHWVVRVSNGNVPALPFWRAAVRDYTGGAFEERRLPGKVHDWTVFVFTSGRPNPKADPGLR